MDTHKIAKMTSTLETHAVNNLTLNFVHHLDINVIDSGCTHAHNEIIRVMCSYFYVFSLSKTRRHSMTLSLFTHRFRCYFIQAVWCIYASVKFAIIVQIISGRLAQLNVFRYFVEIIFDFFKKWRYICFDPYIPDVCSKGVCCKKINIRPQATSTCARGRSLTWTCFARPWYINDATISFCFE